MADPPRLPIDLRAASQRIFGTPRGRRLYLLLGGLLVALVAYGVCTVYVHPNELGVKQVIVGSTKGILPEVYYAGLHFVSPGTERLHVFSTDIQSLDSALDTIASAQSVVGARQNRLDAASSRLQQLEQSTTSLLSNTEDADMAKTIMDYSTQQAVYQSALKAGAMIIQPSLMDYLS